MKRFPTETIERLRHINTSSGSAKHVLLAIGYGICDPQIRRVNNLIISLLIRRLKAERTGDAQVVERVQETMADLHVAIDWLTGVYPPLTQPPLMNTAGVCNKINAADRRVISMRSA